MIDDRNDSKHLIEEPVEEPELDLSTPRFDEKAAANAQPVQPIPVNRLSPFHTIAASFRRGVTSGSRALVLVVIAGLATGTLVGMAWVKERPDTDVTPSARESVSELVPANSTNEEPRAEVFGVTDLQSASPTAARIRKGRPRVKSHRGNRAYRVAVLR